MLHRQIYLGLLFVGILCCSCASLRKNRSELAATDSQSQSEISRKSQYLFLEATRFKNWGKQGAAFDLYKRAVEVDSTNDAALFGLAEYYIRLQQVQKAYQLLDRAISLDKSNYWYNMMQANLSQNLQDNEKAIEIYNNMIALYPDRPELNYMLSEVYAVKEEWQKSIDALDRLEALIGIVESMSTRKFELYMQLDNKEKALAEIQKLIQSNPAEGRYYIILGDVYSQLNQSTEALEAYKKAETIDPDAGSLYMSLANFYDKAGESKAAEQQIKKALFNEKIDVDLKVQIMTGYITTLMRRKDDVKPVYAIFDSLIVQHPQEVEFRRLYSDVLIMNKMFEKAKEQVQIVTDMDPMSEQAWVMLMRLSLSDSSYQQAIKTATRAADYVPDNLEIILYKSIAYNQLKQYEKAIETIRQGIDKTSEGNKNARSNFYGQLGDIYHTAGQREQSYAAYDTALIYNDRNAVVLNNYGYFLSLDKEDLSKAERMSRKAIEIEPSSTYLDTYAWIFFQQGNYTLAKFYMENALEKAKEGVETSGTLYEHYGDILFKLGEIDEAMFYWKKASDSGDASSVLKKKIETKNYIEPE